MPFQTFIVIIILTLTTAVILFSPNTVGAQDAPPIQEVGIIKHKTSPPSHVISSNESNTIPSSSSSSPPQPNTASPSGCINYNPSTRTIIVSCSSPARLSDIDNKLHDSSILAKQSTNGVWFLNANLVIAKGATLHIDSTDTKWLKISSKVTHAGIAKIAPAYIIDVHGSLKIDSVKITSWDQQQTTMR